MAISKLPNSGGPRRELPDDEDRKADATPGAEAENKVTGFPADRRQNDRNERPSSGPPTNRGGGHVAAINLPPVITGMIAIMVLVQAAMSFAPHEVQSWLFFTLGYIPFWRGEFQTATLPGIALHAFLHGGWGHLIMNVLWLVIGGKVISQYLDQKRFVIFFFVTAICGAIASTLINWSEEMVLMGASGVVFGILGAGAWFWVGHVRDSAKERLKKIAIYIAIMMLLNLAYAFVLSDDGSKVAWEAHAGGFFAGLMFFPFLARRPRGQRPGGHSGTGFSA